MSSDELLQDVARRGPMGRAHRVALGKTPTDEGRREKRSSDLKRLFTHFKGVKEDDGGGEADTPDRAGNKWNSLKTLKGKATLIAAQAKFKSKLRERGAPNRTSLKQEVHNDYEHVPAATVPLDILGAQDYVDLIDDTGKLNGTRRSQLAMFQSGEFDAGLFTKVALTSKSEKGIRHLCADLSELKNSSEDELRSSVHDNYAAFIQASREMAELDGKLAVIRDLLNSAAPLLHTLFSGRPGGGTPGSVLSTTGTTTELLAKFDEPLFPPPAPKDSVLEEAQGLPGAIDVLLAERKAEAVMVALARGDELLAQTRPIRAERSEQDMRQKSEESIVASEESRNTGGEGAPPEAGDADDAAPEKNMRRHRRPSLVRRLSIKSYQDLPVQAADGDEAAAASPPSPGGKLRARSFPAGEDGGLRGGEAGGSAEPGGGAEAGEARGAGAEQEGPALPAEAAAALREDLQVRRGALVELLTDLVQESGADSVAAAQMLCQLGSPQHAHAMLLQRHSRVLEMAVRRLRSGGGPTDGTVYTGALCHRVFGSIARAARDCEAVVGESPERTSAFLVWALGETERCAVLIKQQVLGPAASHGNLSMVVDCIRVAVAHCSSLQDIGLALTPAMRRHLVPHVSDALSAQARRLEEETALLVAEEVGEVAGGGKRTFNRLMSMRPDSPTVGGGPTPREGGGGGAEGGRRGGGRPEVEGMCRSGKKLLALLESLLADVQPYATQPLLELASKRVLGVFHAYQGHLRKAMKPSSARAGARGSSKGLAEHERPALRVLASAMALARLLPSLLDPWVPAGGGGGDGGGAPAMARRWETRKRQMEREMGRSGDSLRDEYCSWRAHVLVSGGDAVLSLSPREYAAGAAPQDVTQMEPSVCLMALPGLLLQGVVTAEEMLPGGAAGARILVGHLVEAVVHAYGTDQRFWAGMGARPVPSRTRVGASDSQEDAPEPEEAGSSGGFSEAGLLQFALDMHFVRAVGAAGCTVPRTLLPAVRRIVEHAAGAFKAASGRDGRAIVANAAVQRRAEEVAHGMMPS